MNTDTLIQSTSGDAWLAIIGVVIGALFTLLGVWQTNRSNIENLKIQLEHSNLSERKKANQERLEELYILTSHALEITNNRTLLMLSVAAKKIDYDSFLNYELKEANPDGKDFLRIKMLIEIYFPQYKEQYDAIVLAKDEIEKAFKVFRSGPSVLNNTHAESTKAIVEAQRVCTVAGNDFLKSICKEAQNLN